MPRVISSHAFAALAALVLATASPAVQAADVVDNASCQKEAQALLDAAKARPSSMDTDTAKIFHALIADAQRLCQTGKVEEGRQHLGAARNISGL